MNQICCSLLGKHIYCKLGFGEEGFAEKILFDVETLGSACAYKF